MRSSLMVLAVVLCAALPSCAPGPAELRVGVISYILPEREPSSLVEGWSTNHAVDLAVAQLNAPGGILIGDRLTRLRVVHRDINLAPEEAVEAVQYLVNRENVSVILGPSMSSQAIAAGGAAEQARVPLISSVSSNPATTAGRSFVFRMCYTDRIQAAALLEYAAQTIPGGPWAVVFEEQDPFSSGIAASLASGVASTGGPAPLALTVDAPDWNRALDSLAPFQQTLIFVPTASDFAVRLATTLRDRGYRGPFLGADGWIRDQIAAQPAFEGSAMATNYIASQDTPGNRAFVDAYRAAAGRDPGDTAALTYDSVYLVARAAQAAGTTDSVALRDAIAGLEGFHGVGGAVSFQGSGDPSRSVVFLKFSGGSYHFETEVDPAP